MSEWVHNYGILGRLSGIPNLIPSAVCYPQLLLNLRSILTTDKPQMPGQDRRLESHPRRKSPGVETRIVE